MAVFVSVVESHRGVGLCHSELVVAPVATGVVGVIHHVVFAMVFYNPRAFGHGVIHPLPCVWQRCELAEEFVVELAVVFHFTCPDGVAVGEAHHIHVEVAVVIAEHFRVDAVIHPAVSDRLGIRPHGVGSLGMDHMHRMAVVPPVVYRPVGMDSSVVVHHVVGMNLPVVASRAFDPVVIHIYDMDGLAPVYQVRRYVEVAVGAASSEIIFAVVFHHPDVGHIWEDWIRDVALTGRCRSYCYGTQCDSCQLFHGWL